MAVFRQTGLSDDEIEKSFNTSQDILENNKNRSDLIFRGVRRVDDEA